MTKKYEVGPDGVLTDAALADILDIAINEKKSMLASRRDIAATQHELDQAHEAEAVKAEKELTLAEIKRRIEYMGSLTPDVQDELYNMLDEMAKG